MGTAVNKIGGLNQVGTLINRHKMKANYISNGAAALFCGLTALNGNFNVFGESLQHPLEKISELFCKVATILCGVINSANGQESNNALTAIGSALEVPVGLFVSNYNLWMYRAFPLFGQNMQAFASKLEVRDKNNLRGDRKLIDDIKEGGYFAGLGTITKEFPHIISELFTNPSKSLKSCPHVLFAGTSLQVLGAITALLKQEILGSGIRNTGGILVDLAFILDYEAHKNKKDPNAESGNSYFAAGAVWGIASILDFVKRFDWFESKIKNGTELNLLLDRGATALFTAANNLKKKSVKPQEVELKKKEAIEPTTYIPQIAT